MGSRKAQGEPDDMRHTQSGADSFSALRYAAAEHATQAVAFSTGNKIRLSTACCTASSSLMEEEHSEASLLRNTRTKAVGTHR